MPSFDEFAGRQDGYLDRRQAGTAGLSQRELDHLVREKHLQRPHPGVYLTGSAPPRWEGKVRAAVMAAGGASRAMGRTAARLRAWDGHESHTLIELTVPMTCGPLPKGVRVHHTRRIDPALTTIISGMPVSSVNQNLLELAWLIRAHVPVERAVEDAFRRDQSSEGSLRRFLASCGKGVNGVTHLRWILDNRPAGRPARSGFEVIVLDILRDAGLPLPLRRPLVSVPPDQKFELDLAYMDEKIDIEPMGEKFHGTRHQQAGDAERRRVLPSHGWLIVEVRWHEAINTPREVAERVRKALKSRNRTF